MNLSSIPWHWSCLDKKLLIIPPPLISSIPTSALAACPTSSLHIKLTHITQKKHIATQKLTCHQCSHCNPSYQISHYKQPQSPLLWQCHKSTHHLDLFFHLPNLATNKNVHKESTSKEHHFRKMRSNQFRISLAIIIFCSQLIPLTTTMKFVRAVQCIIWMNAIEGTMPMLAALTIFLMSGSSGSRWEVIWVY